MHTPCMAQDDTVVNDILKILFSYYLPREEKKEGERERGRKRDFFSGVAKCAGR